MCKVGVCPSPQGNKRNLGQRGEAQTPRLAYEMNFKSDNTCLFVFDTFLSSATVLNGKKLQAVDNRWSGTTMQARLSFGYRCTVSPE